MPDVYVCEIIDLEELTHPVYSVSLLCPAIANMAHAGQFVNIKCGNERLLRRPVSICSVENDNIKLVFEVKGKGTKWLSESAPGQFLDVLGPLGSGFSIPDGNIIVAGGGMGVPPLLFAAESAKGDVTAVLGYRGADRIILKKEFESCCKNVYITTDDGSFGIKGTVISPLEELLRAGKTGAVLACGPRLMLSAVAAVCRQYDTFCQVSLEERMGCGIGACLVCACETSINGIQGKSRVCRDGPVFDATEVVWN